MRFAYTAHIIAGSVALLSGYVALYVSKGATLHRKSGMVFVYAMLAMAMVGMALAVLRPAAPEINVPAALLTSYLVVTALTTVRAPVARWIPWAGIMLVSAVAIYNLNFGIELVATPRKGIPPFPFLMFGVVGSLCAIGDWRMMRRGALTGTMRIARHLWRMTFALLIAAMSFFIGQAKVIPKPIRIGWLLALPVLAIVVTLFYWLWRIPIRRSLRGVVVQSEDRVVAGRDARAARRGTADRETVRRVPSIG